MEKKKTKVAVGLSGGVDSAVAAWLLQQQGYQVIAIFMINWHDTTGVLEGGCPAEHDLVLARLVARHLGIELHVVDFSEQYSRRVVEYMFEGYRRGVTPNPDVLCNREIKFDPFIQKAKELGAEYFATGHYARRDTIEVNGKTIHRLLAGLDPAKDQSYFLCQLSQEQLQNVLFPVGELTKQRVREMAVEINLPVATRKDSQGICFVGKVDLPVFLQQKLKPRSGDIIEIPVNFAYPSLPELDMENPDTEILKAYTTAIRYRPTDGRVVGRHKGAHYFTIGQRKGLNVGGKAEPLFVLATDVDDNMVYTGQGQGHPGLYRKGLFIRREDVHWIRLDLSDESTGYRDYMVRIRYRQPLQKARLFLREEGIYMIFDTPQRGITSGQFAAWYTDDELIGSGVIA
ncbi:MAG: tRNA 2-thiouridine(34) synthase MnmA [Bacteroidales bacterium]